MSTLRLLLVCLFAVVATAAVVVPTPLFAQNGLSAEDYDEWAKVADRAEAAVEAGRASELALEDLRAQLTEWRTRFANAQNTNSARIETLQSQLSALGTAPEDGSEPEEITARRDELTQALAVARVPVLRAEEAHSRADGLVSQIDTLIREQQTDALLELWPTPLNPINWEDAVREFGATTGEFTRETTVSLADPTQQSVFKKNLPLILLLFAIGLVLAMRARRWTEALVDRISVKRTILRDWLCGLISTVGQIVLPFLGVLALTEAVYATGFVGLRGDVLLSGIPLAAIAFLLARWLGMRIFPKAAADDAYFDLTAEQNARGRWISGGLGLLLGLQVLLTAFAVFENYSNTALSVLAFPLIVLFAILTFGLGRLIRNHRTRISDETEELTFRARLVGMIGLAAMLASGLAIVLAAIGYYSAAVTLVYPTAVSLALFALLLILQRWVTDIYALFSGSRETANEALVPVLIGFGLTLAATPLFALIWGARVATLREFWTKFTNGITFGETTISPSVFLTLAVIFTIGLVVTRLVQATLRNTVLPKTKLDTGGRNAIVSGTGYVGIFLAAIIAITGAGIDLSSLAIVAGALSVGIGFGLQNIVSNFVSGIILLIERPISEGDWIEVGGNSGYVRSISVRSTRIETFDRADVIVPNADLISGVVMNMTKGSLTGRVIVPVGVAYGNDTHKVASILQEIAEAHPMVVLNPAPGIIFQGFGADSLDFEIRAILRDVNWMLSVKSDMNHEIARRFAEEGIEIPFAQRDIWLRNPEVLTGKDQPPQAGPSKQEKAQPATKTDATAEIDFSTKGEPTEDD
ncbi:DUF3772 domain-containing protein [Aliiroseovarius sp. YM-037]|uniref:DUF3772 domain-containing protein n=1 Tax=Aliiroseovarius sp. YM-037 TaxID=3341728 RepID=UPI003A811F08